MFSKNEIVGNYRVIRPLGEGGMAAVYEVEHLKLGVHYALKTFTLQDGHVELFRKRFSAEGKILARLNHPNLVRVIDLDLDEKAGALYYVMDLILSAGGQVFHHGGQVQVLSRDADSPRGHQPLAQGTVPCGGRAYLPR